MTGLLQRLKMMRRRKRLTQDMVAKKLGFFSKNGYWSIENGKTKLNVDQVKILAGLYGVSVDFILFGSESETGYNDKNKNHENSEYDQFE